MLEVGVTSTELVKPVPQELKNVNVVSLNFNDKSYLSIIKHGQLIH